MTEAELVNKIHRELVVALRILENSKRLRRPGVRALYHKISSANCSALTLHRRFEGESIPKIGD